MAKDLPFTTFRCVKTYGAVPNCCDDCETRLHFFKECLKHFNKLTRSEQEKFTAIAGKTDWYVNMAHGLSVIGMDNVSGMSQEDIATLRQEVQAADKFVDVLGRPQRRTIGQQTSIFICCRVSSKRKLLKFYMAKVKRSMQTIQRRPDLYPNGLPEAARTKKLVVEGYYASPGPASSSVFAMTQSLETSRGMKYLSFASLAARMKRMLSVGDTQVIAMAHPLHFIAGRRNLLAFILQLQQHGIPLPSTFFAVLGMEILNNKLLISPAHISIADLLDELVRPKNSETPASRLLACMDLGILKRAQGERGGRSIFDELPG